MSVGSELNDGVPQTTLVKRGLRPPFIFKEKPRPGKPLGYSPWIGRWATYWRIKKYEKWNPEIHAIAEGLASRYRWTWEVRLILWWMAANNIKRTKSNEQCELSEKSPTSTGS